MGAGIVEPCWRYIIDQPYDFRLSGHGAETDRWHVGNISMDGDQIERRLEVRSPGRHEVA
jgi:hypothetical protein